MQPSRRMSRTAKAIALLLLSVGVLSLFPDAGSAAPSAHAATIDAAVSTALESDANVVVIVSLQGSPGDGGAQGLQDGIKEAQDRVLSDLRLADFAVVHRYQAVPALAGTAASDVIARLAAHPDVAAVSLDRPLQATLAESVPLINADDVHSLGVTGEGVIAAVMDTGSDTDHPDLADDLLSEACFLNEIGEEPPGPCHNGQPTDSGPGSAEDDAGHGSHVSGIITSAGTVAPVGVAPDTSIRAYRVLNSEGSGSFSDLLAAYDDVIVNHPDVDIINMSLSDGGSYGPGACDGLLPAFDSIIATTRSMGMTSFAAAGNSGSKSGLGYPACLSDVVSVGAVYDADIGSASFSTCSDATTAADQVTCFSQSSAGLNLLAPGSRIDSTLPGGVFGAFSGTSMASPTAAGAAALLLESEPTLQPAAVETRLTETGTPVFDPASGVTACRIDALEAVVDDGGPVCATSGPPPPANDDFADAIVVSEPLPYGNSQITLGATTETGEPLPCGLIGATIWYRLTVTADTAITADTVGSNFDTVLAAYSGAALPALSLIDCNDDAVGTQSQVEFVASAGVTYHLQIGGFLGAGGDLTLNIDGAPLKLPSPGDTDGDGCSDEQENGLDERFGGQRNYLYFWDFFDVWTHPLGQPTVWVRDKVVNLPGDILGVARRFGQGTVLSKEAALAAALTEPTDESSYHAAFDRGPIIGANNWDVAPADGAINIPDDILGVARQFGHACA